MDESRLKVDLLTPNIKSEDVGENESDIEDVEGMTSEPLEIQESFDIKNEIECCIPNCEYSCKEDDFIPGKILTCSSQS